MFQWLVFCNNTKEPNFHSSPVFASIVASLEAKFNHRGKRELLKMGMCWGRRPIA